MATIEPRLIHLLNESTATPRPHNAELPPIKVLPFPQTSGRPLPIEPSAGQRSEALETNAAQSIPYLYSLTDDALTTSSSRKDKSSYTTTDRPPFSTHVSSQDLRMILEDNVADSLDDVSNKKRPVKEDFPQLPQPQKKQKAQNQSHLFPPMIVGLLEPPSNAALFPPISSPSFNTRPRSEPPHALNITKPPDVQGMYEESVLPSPPPDPVERPSTAKAKRRAAKPRRKWSEEETNNLLLGVSKHGVGRWTDILEDKDYNFNERSAGDLKDRFRTCCPEELRGSRSPNANDEPEKAARPAKHEKRPRKGLMAENILNETEEDIDLGKSTTTQHEYETAPKQRKSRAHRKKMEDLVELGIKGPFKKSQRRGRRPFSEQDDREILEGFELYGPHWTKIQRDPRFNLSSRQPTDLRDRLRNKYPEKFSTEKTTMQVREASGRGNSLLEPTINMEIDGSIGLSKTSLLEPQLPRTGSREDIPKWPLASGFVDLGETAQVHSTSYWGDGTTGGFSTGEMDISRLLLDDPQHTNE
ncbi:hypothetical protein F5Y16DRAFT_382314 [Xylariaceae sp. FL0255]|nr:hypothetical protein F5Y16DRAFT_382314 [Xylariaceae sp. FL0255]